MLFIGVSGYFDANFEILFCVVFLSVLFSTPFPTRDYSIYQKWFELDRTLYSSGTFNIEFSIVLNNHFRALSFSQQRLS